VDSASLASSRSYKHPLFSVLLPFGFIWLVAACLRAALPVALQRLPAVYPLLLLVAALSETAVGNYLVSRKAHGILPRLRELIVLLLFSYLFVKLVNGDLFRGDWSLARLDVVLPLLFAGVEWILSFVIHSALRDRELLLALVVDRERGELRESFRNMGTEAIDALAGMVRVRRLIVTFQVLGFLALFVVGIARPQSVSGGLAALALAHFALGCVFFFTITGYMESQALMGEGFVVSRRIVSRRATFAAALCLVACLALIPAVGRDPPLPSSYLQAFVAWLQRILTLPEPRGAREAQENEQRATDLGMDQQALDLAALGESGQVNEALQRLIKIIILVLVIGAPGAAIVILLVAPLFRRREEKLHPLRALRRWLAGATRALAQAARNLAAALRHRPRGTGPRKTLREVFFGTARADEGPTGEGRAGFFQRLGLSREVRTFVKIIRWGERRGVRYERSLGPREYAGSLGSQIPGVRAEIDRLAALLEELLFSGREIGRQRTEEYFETARLVLRYR
jgi:hypothetical protein